MRNIQNTTDRVAPKVVWFVVLLVCLTSVGPAALAQDPIFDPDPIWLRPEQPDEGFGNDFGAFNDANRDGFLDLVLNAGHTIELYFNERVSTVYTTVGEEWSNAGEPNDLVFCDVDGDGFPDLTWGDEQDNRLLLNRGGTWDSEPIWSSTPRNDSRSLELGDVDGDGDLDVVFGNGWTTLGERNCLYLNAGSDSVFMADPIWQSHTVRSTQDVALGDLDGDGDLDLVCANAVYDRALESSTLFLNRSGEGVPSIFNADPDYQYPAEQTFALALGDVDGDGDLDLVTGNNSRCKIHLNRFDEGPPWIQSVFDENPAWEFTGYTGGKIGPIELGDVDGDGDLDLFAGGGSTASGALFLNIGAPGIFATEPAWEFDPGLNCTGLTLGDVDNDGDLDLLSVYLGPGEFPRLYRNESPVLERTALEPMATTESTRAVALGDVNGDGHPDLVCGNDGQSRLYLNIPTYPGNFLPGSQWTNTGHSPTRGIALVDLDLDGHLDLVCGNSQEENTAFLGTGTSFSPWPAWVSIPPANTTSVAAADLDGDGYPELVFGNLGEPNQVYGNAQGTPTVYPEWSSGESRDTRSVALGDMDGDGDVDLVCGNAWEKNTIYLNEGGTFEEKPSWEPREAYNTMCVAVGDVNGDGYLDLVSGNYNQPTRLYLSGAGVIPQDSAWDSPVMPTRSVALVDMDADGDLDLLCGNGHATTELFVNIGGTFTRESVWSTDQPRWTFGIAAGDIDGDGDMDLVCGNQSEVTGLHFGQRNPVLRFDPVAPTNHLPQNPTFIDRVSVQRSADNRYLVELTAVDVESDPFLLLPRYRYINESHWRPVNGGEIIGPLDASPAGTTSQFEWDVSTQGIDPREVVVGLYVLGNPNSLAKVDRVASYHKNVGPLQVRRPQSQVTPTTLVFPTVTLGDTVSGVLTVANTGNETLNVSSVTLPSSEMSLEDFTGVSVPAGDSREITIRLGPRLETQVAGNIEVLSDAPLTPMVAVPVQTDVRSLAVRTKALLSGDTAPLGDALTIHVLPDDDVHLERGALHYKAAGEDGSFASLELTPQEGFFIGIIPGSEITEEGLCYYIELENSGVFATDPGAAPDSLYCLEVEAAQVVEATPIPSAESGFLAGRPVRVEVSLPQGSVFQHGSLHYRRGGYSSFHTLDLLFDGPLPVATIPESSTGPRGLEYWIGVRTAGDTLTAPLGNPAENPFTIPVTVQDLSESRSFPALQYRMISIPLRFGEEFDGTLEALLSDQPEFGPYGRNDPPQSQWRCFRWLPGDGRYAELSEEDQAAQFRPEPGRGFWLVSRSDNQVATSPVTGFSTPTDSAYTVALEPGYNQVGNPFNFPVSWDSVLVDGQAMADAEGLVVEPLVSWTGSSYRFDERTLAPFGGYWVNNLDSGQVILSVPAKEAPPQPEPAAKSEEGWRLQIVASCGDVHDDFNVVGVHPEAKEGWDRHDRSEPPTSPADALSLYFPHSTWSDHPAPYTADIRTTDIGHVWSFDIAKNFNDGEVHLEFEGLDILPADHEVWLIDRELLRRVDISREGTYSYHQGIRDLVTDEPNTRFQLLVGTEAFISEYEDELPGVPSQTVLYQNRPNPFNPATVIRYDIAQAGQVSLRIYDVSGALVKELVAGHRGPGRYDEVWQGDDVGGQRVATGMYFYRLVTQKFSVTKKMLIVK